VEKSKVAPPVASGDWVTKNPLRGLDREKR